MTQEEYNQLRREQAIRNFVSFNFRSSFRNSNKARLLTGVSERPYLMRQAYP